MRTQDQSASLVAHELFLRVARALAHTPIGHMTSQDPYRVRTHAALCSQITYRHVSANEVRVCSALPALGISVDVDFTLENGKFYFDSTCSQCGRSGDGPLCLHSSAVVFSLGTYGTGDYNAPTVRYDEEKPRLASGIAKWLDGLANEGDEASSSRAPSLPVGGGLRFLISTDESGTVRLRSVFMTDVEPIKKARPLDFTSQSTARERAIAAQVSEEERGWLMQLRACVPIQTKGSFEIRTTLDQQFARMLIERGRALYTGVGEDAIPPRVRMGEPRSIAPSWEVTNALTCKLNLGLALSKDEVLLDLPDAWIFDRRVAAIYPIRDVTTAQIKSLRQAPEVPRDQIKLFAEALRKIAGVPISPPEEIPDPEVDVVEPRAMVVLSTAMDRYSNASYWQRQASNTGKVPIIADVFFRYAKGRVSADDTQTTQVITRRDGMLLAHPRQAEQETALLKKIHAAGLKRETAYDQMSRRQLWAAPDNIGGEAIALMQALASKGIQVELAPNLGVRCIEDAGDETYGGVEEGGNGKYVIDAGVVVDGHRIDLADLASAAMIDPDFSLTPDPEHDADRRLLVPCGKTMVVSLPHARVREIIGPFFDFLVALQNGSASASKDRQGRLVVSRAVLIAQAFENRSEGPSMFGWEGMQSIREAAARLREHGIEEVPVTPAGFVGELRDYQQTGVKWLNVMHELGLGAVLADDMGLGKSVQLLAHIHMRRSKRTEAPVLIVAPAPVIGSWEDKFHFTPGLRMLVLTGQDRASRFDQISDADVVYTNYTTLRLDIATLGQHRYSLIVFDEAQNLKNINTVSHAIAERLQADQVVAVSGRPIENHLGELYSQIRLALPGLLGEQRDFTRSFRTPIEKHADGEAKQRLRNRVLPFILRRTKDQVTASLPPKTVMLNTVAMGPEQQRLYNAIMLTMNRRVWDSVAKKGISSSSIIILDSIRKLQQICCHPRLLEEDQRGGCDESTKFEFLLSQLDELLEEGRRILIFSQYVSYLKLISEALKERAIEHLVFTGDTRDKDGTRAAFQSGRYPIMLVSLKAGGAGMDFTAADTVIMASPWWSPGAEDQAIDRAHRIGQTKAVFVFKHFVENSIETRILQMQEKKAALARAILDDDAGAAPPQFDVEDVINLFGQKDAVELQVANVIDGDWSEVAETPRAPRQLPRPTVEIEPGSLSPRAVVSEWLGDAIAAAGLTAAEVNRQLQLPKQWLSNRISGNSLLPPSMLIRAARTIDARVPPEVLSAAQRAYGRDDPDLAGLLGK